jgi:hypothetical protein
MKLLIVYFLLSIVSLQNVTENKKANLGDFLESLQSSVKE